MTVSLYKTDNTYHVNINGLKRSFENERQAEQYMHLKLTEMESCINSAIETYFCNKHEQSEAPLPQQ